MRNLLALLFLVSFVPACSDAAPIGNNGSSSSGGSGGEGGSGGSGGSGGGAETPNEAVKLVCDLVRDVCERQVACGHPVVNTAADVEACIEAQRCETLAEILQSPDYELDTNAVAACTAAIETATCGALVTRGLDIAAACKEYIVGKRLEGESCRGGLVSDCAKGLICAGDTCPGTCTKEATNLCKEGSCGTDGFCNMNGECRPRAAIGQACDDSEIAFGNLSDNSCALGAHCDNFVCVANLELGAACAGQAPNACGPGLTCQCPDPAACGNPDAFICVPASNEGGACNWAMDCQPGLFCNFQAENGAVCAQRVGQGEACNDSYGACEHLLECVNGKCVEEQEPIAENPLLKEGESCTFGGSCELGTACTCTDAGCQEQTCQKAPGLGQSCADLMLANITPFACAEGLCDLLGGYTCVMPAPAGAPCDIEGYTFACASTVCSNGKCASFEDLRCPE